MPTIIPIAFQPSNTTCPPTSVIRTFPGTSSPRNGVFLPWLISADGSTRQCASGSKMQTSAGAPTPSCPPGRTEDLRRPGRDAGEPVRERNAILRRPLQRQRQQELEARRSRLGFAERQLLGIVVDRCVVRAHQVDGAVGKAGPQRRAVAGSAQRRNQTALRVEPADVDVAKMQVVRGDVARHGQPLLLRGAHHRHALGGREPAQMHAHAGGADQREDRRQRDRLRGRRYRRQAEPRRDLAVVRDASLGEMRILRAQPDAMPERRRVLHGAKQHAGVGERHLGLRERDAPRLGELAHLRELHALEADRQRADRVDVRVVERAGAVLQHLDQARLVERRIGVRRTGEARHSTRDGGLHLRFQRCLVLESRLAQPRGQIDESRADDETGRVDAAIRVPAGRRVADGGDPAGGDVERSDPVDARASGRSRGRV